MSQFSNAFYSHIAQTSDDPMGLEIDHAEGCLIRTTDGRTFVDLISGIAVSSLGHRHPAVIEAIQQQLERHLHVMVYGEFIQTSQSALAGLLASLLPESLERIYFVNSGTEAIEGALKLAKKHTGRHKFVSFHNSYHGDTQGALSVTGRAIYRDAYLPLLPGVDFLEFNNLEDLDRIDEETAAVILEPIQGEGGVIPAEREWLQAVRRRCDEVGALLIFDEIQSGLFRTGKLFAFEHYRVVPDILCMAKALGGGMPLGAFASSTDIFKVFRTDPPLNHVTTFGGHPVSCAAAHANLEVLVSGNFGERAARIEETVRERLSDCPGVVEVRGIGGMLGLQLEASELARKVVDACFEEGVILGWTLHSDTLIRIAPPLVIGQDLLEKSLVVIVDALQHTAS